MFLWFYYYLSQALWVEYYKGVDIWTYINEAENYEYLQYRSVDEAVYKWMQTPYYESGTSDSRCRTTKTT